MLGKVLHNSGHRPEALRHLKRAKRMAIASDILSSSIYFWISYVYYHEKRCIIMRRGGPGRCEGGMEAF